MSSQIKQDLIEQDLIDIRKSISSLNTKLSSVLADRPKVAHLQRTQDVILNIINNERLDSFIDEHISRADLINKRYFQMITFTSVFSELNFLYPELMKTLNSVLISMFDNLEWREKFEKTISLKDWVDLIVEYDNIYNKQREVA